jgi:uncharacterized protein
MAGDLVHFEIAAENAERAKRFWGELCGWSFETWGGPIEYHMFQGNPGGGLFEAENRDGHLLVYFGSDDVDGDAGKVRELGGSAEEKFAVPGVGWIVRCTDTEGNAFSLWQGDESAGA